jgi:hypothetical protein
MELTGTNRSCGLIPPTYPRSTYLVDIAERGFGLAPCTLILEYPFPVTIAEGKHLFPFRTQKLSPPALMVLRG